MTNIEAAAILSLPPSPWTPRLHTLDKGTRAAVLPFFYALLILTTPIGPLIAITKETSDSATWGKTVGATARAALDHWSSQTKEDISGAVRMPASPIALQAAHRARDWYAGRIEDSRSEYAVYAAGIEAWIELSEHRGRRLARKRNGMGTLTRMADRAFVKSV